MARSIHGPSSRTTGVFRALERTGFRKGLLGHRHWFYVGTGLWTLRTIRRMAGDREEILISERLKPGQRIVIANAASTVAGQPAPVRLSRRKAKKARKEAVRDAKAAKRSARKAKRAKPVATAA